MNLKLNKADFKSTDSMTKIYRAEAVTPAFSVSVTGHRYLAASDNQELNNLIKIVLDNIASACLKSNKNTQLRFNSALAAGADQLAANVVKEGNESAKANSQEANDTPEAKKQWSLQVLLPFERRSYEAGLYNNLDVPDGADKFQELLCYAERVFEIADLKYVDCWEEKDTSLAKFWEKNRFHTLGELLVRQADLLLALWDGGFDGGKGGTSDVITIALRNGKPVLHINPKTLKIALLTPERGITVPLFPDDRSDAVSNEDTLKILFTAEKPKNDSAEDTDTKKKKSGLEPPEFKGYLSKLVKHLIERPQPLKDTNRFSTIEAFIDDPAPPETPRDKWKSLFQWLVQKIPLVRKLLPKRIFPERSEPYMRWIMYQQFVKFIVWLFPHEGLPVYKRLWKFIANWFSNTDSGKKNKPHQEINDEKNALPETNPPRFQTQVDYAKYDWQQDPILSESYESLHKQITTSDYPGQIAEAETELHLSMMTADAIATARGHAYRSSYILIFLGGAIAVLIGLAGLFVPDLKYVFVLTEMLLLSLLTVIFLIASHRAWHTRWLNARHISESLRAKRFITWLGFGGRQSMNDDAPWTAWYLNSVLASTRLPNTVVTSSDIDYMAAELRGHVKYQRQYHEGNFSKLMSMHHGLEKIGTACLIVTLVVGFWYVVESFKCFGISPCTTMLKNAKLLVTVMCAGLPVIAGALLAIRFQGDFERFAERSEQTKAQLQKIDNRLEQLLARQPESKTQPGYEELVRIVSDLTEIYEEDIEDWHYVYSAKPTPEVG